MNPLKKNIISILIFLCVISLLLGLSYQLNKSNLETTTPNELTITIEGGGIIVRNNIKKIIIFKDQQDELEYLKIIYPQDLNQEEIYNIDRIINFNYQLQVKDKIKFKALSELKI